MLRSHRKTVKKSGSICNFAGNGGEFVNLTEQSCWITAIITPDVPRCSEMFRWTLGRFHLAPGHESSSPTQVQVFDFAQG